MAKKRTDAADAADATNENCTGNVADDENAESVAGSVARAARAVLAMKLPRENELCGELERLGLETTGAQALLLVQFRKALDGDNAAAKFVRDAAEDGGETVARVPDMAAFSDEQLRFLAQIERN